VCPALLDGEAAEMIEGDGSASFQKRMDAMSCVAKEVEP
jgi:hypothetical protein